MSRETTHPFLINKDAEGHYRLTVRDTRYNSQGYPLITATLLEDCFRTAAAARLFARDNYRAEPGQFTTK